MGILILQRTQILPNNLIVIHYLQGDKTLQSLEGILSATSLMASPAGPAFTPISSNCSATFFRQEYSVVQLMQDYFLIAKNYN